MLRAQTEKEGLQLAELLSEVAHYRQELDRASRDTLESSRQVTRLQV